MKKILSTIIGALAAVSFAAIVSAADVPANNDQTSAPAATKTETAKPMVKKHKAHKHHKHHKKAGKKASKKAMKKTAPTSEAAPSSVPAPPASQPAPATPAAK